MSVPQPRQQPLDPLHLHRSRPWMAFVCALTGIVVGFAGYYWFALIGLFRGATYAWLYGPPAGLVLIWALFWAWQFLKRGPVVVIDADGITDHRLGNRPVPWEDIVQMNIKVIDRGGTNLVVTLRDMEAARDHLGKLRAPVAWMDNRAYGGHWRVRLTSLDYNGTELLRRANDFAFRARAQP